MGVFDFFKQPDIRKGLKEYETVAGALLLDVRTPEEYYSGHIPGSKNIPLQSIGTVSEIAANKDTPLFVYCHSGARSRRAAELLRKAGYRQVTNLGGITAYEGKVEN